MQSKVDETFDEIKEIAMELCKSAEETIKLLNKHSEYTKCTRDWDGDDIEELYIKMISDDQLERTKHVIKELHATLIS